MTKLGAVSKPVSQYTGSPRINDISRNSGISDLHTTGNSNELHLHNPHHSHPHHPHISQSQFQ